MKIKGELFPIYKTYTLTIKSPELKIKNCYTIQIKAYQRNLNTIIKDS